MKFIFDAAAWREAFTRCRGGCPKVWKWAYSMYLLSNAWKIKRAQRRAIDGDQCTSPLCFRVDTLQVHHKTYERIGDENVETDLVTLCDRCHGMEHSDEITNENHPLASIIQRA
jgi:cytochrome c553